MKLKKFFLLIPIILTILVAIYFCWQSYNDPVKKLNRSLVQDIMTWSDRKETPVAINYIARTEMGLDDTWVFRNKETKLQDLGNAYIIDLTYWFENKDLGQQKLKTERYYYDPDTVVPVILRQDIPEIENNEYAGDTRSKYLWAGDFDQVCNKPEGSVF